MNCQLKVLKDSQSELLSSLKGADLNHLANELFKILVIESWTLDKFTLLDHNKLEFRVRLRYLMMHVCESIALYPQRFQTLVHTLSELGWNNVSMSLIKRLKHEASKSEATSCCGNKDEDTMSDTLILEKDVPILSEIVANYSFKWNLIGTALHLPMIVLKNLELKEVTQGRQICLRDVFFEWITGSYEYSRPATLQSLKLALKGTMVGLGSIIPALEERLSESKCNFSSEISMKSDFSIEYQSGNTEVNDSKSALLEVQVRSNEDEVYQWMKDGQLLSDDLTYSGTNTPVLFIACVSQRLHGGKFCCEVRNSSETINSNEVKLSVIYSLQKKHLLNLYSCMGEVPKDDWPPVRANKFLNLTLYKKGEVNDAYDYYPNRNLGEDLVHNKTELDYEREFQDIEGILLIEGHPGCGKTTLAHKLVRDWATGKKVLVHMDRLYFIPLRTLDSGVGNLSNILEDIYFPVPAENVWSDLLLNNGCNTCFILDGLEDYKNMNSRDSVIRRLLHRECLTDAAIIVTTRPVASTKIRDSCRIVEVLGFTEEILLQYIENYSFRNEKILGELKQFLERHPNILFMCHLPLYAAMICFMYNQLEGNVPSIETQFYQYFIKWTILRTLQHSSHTERITLASLDSLEQKDRQKIKNICFLAFTMMIQSQQVASQEAIDVRLAKEVSLDESSLGLVTIDSTPQLFGYEDSYTFHHRTLQEYYAAYHIAHLEEGRQRELLVHYGNRNDMDYVWKFYCGLVDFKSDSSKFESLIAIGRDDLFGIQCAFESQQTCICNSVVDQGEPGALIFENNVLSWADFAAISYVVISASSPVIKLKFIDCTVNEDGLEYFFASISSETNSVRHLSYHSMARQNVSPLRRLLKAFSRLEVLDLQILNASEKCLHMISMDIQLPHLKILTLPNLPPVYQHIDSFKFFSKSLEEVYCYYHPTLINGLLKTFGFRLMDLPRHIRACNMHLDFSGIAPSKFSHCTKLILYNCLIDDYRCILLTKGFNGAMKLRTLDLGFNMIARNGAIHLAEWLRMRTDLKRIILHCNKIDDCGAQRIARALIYCTKLEMLDLQYNAINDTGALIGIIESVHWIPTSRLKLYLNNIDITKHGNERVLMRRKNVTIERETPFQLIWKFIIESGPKSFSSALKCSSSLPLLEITDIEFQLSWMEALVQESDFLSSIKYLALYCVRKFTVEGIEVLGQGLKMCNQLQTLNLSGNLLDSDSIKVLVPELTSCQCLQTLNLSKNRICTHGAEMLAEGLNFCSKLRWLDLSSNNIGPDGAQALEDKLSVAISVNLSSNPTESGSELIEASHMYATDNQIQPEEHTI